MARARDPNRNKAFEIYKKHDGKIDLVEIASQLNISPGTIRGWKSKDSWDITLAGVFFDEVALMPESFVNQATGRCSVKGSKFWFNCNPDGPYHWFKVNWIDKCAEKNILYLHFTMDDNLSLDEEIKARYRSMYVGVFFKRYIMGLWAAAEGIIYDMFDDARHVRDIKDFFQMYSIKSMYVSTSISKVVSFCVDNTLCTNSLFGYSLFKYSICFSFNLNFSILNTP